jgi:hypothetical protein
MICLYFGIDEECPSCGGWTKAGGPPFHALDGVAYCSDDCAEEAAEFRSRTDHLPYFCEACGTDDPSEHWGNCESS